MQISSTFFMLLGDDIHDIFALINGKIVSFLVQNMQIISAYLLPHPPPSHPTYPAGAPVAQWVKRWPTNLADRVRSSLTRGEIFSTINGVPLHAAFHYHPNIVLI